MRCEVAAVLKSPFHCITRQQLESESKAGAGLFRLNGRLACSVINRYPMFVPDEYDRTAQGIVDCGLTEAWVSVALMRALRPGMRCLDVGAYLGCYTLMMAGAVGPSGCVIAVEGSHSTATGFLEPTIEANGFSDFVGVVNAAGCDRSGAVIEFGCRDYDQSTSSMLQWQGTSEHRTETVQTVTIDGLCAEWISEGRGPDIIKIDVEGAEGLVLGGARETVAACPRLTIVLELHRQHERDQTHAAIDRIEALGFHLRKIDNQGDIVPTTRSAIMGDACDISHLWLAR